MSPHPKPKELSDLPPEILNQIIALYINETGVTAAWRIRGVCGAFSSIISHNILAKQSISAFLKQKPHSGRKILEMNMADYLKYRMNKLNGAHPFAPNFVASILNRIEKLTGVVDSTTRTKNESTLCDALVKECRSCLFLFITQSFLSKDLQSKKWIFGARYRDRAITTAAVATGNWVALDMPSKSKPRILWERSTTFGYPLAVAAYTGQHSMVENILKRSRGSVSLWREESFRSALVLSLEARQFDVTKLLVRSCPRYLRVVEKADYDLWLRRAIGARDAGVVSAILKLKHNGESQCYAAALMLACKTNQPAIVRLFFEKSLLDIASFPLHIAVQTENLEVVRELLKMGARPDGPTPPQKLEINKLPLWVAVRHDNWNMVQLLLDHGANPDIMTASPAWLEDTSDERVGKFKQCLIPATGQTEISTLA